MTDERPPQAVVIQLVIGAWASQAISAVTRLGVPDLLERHGPSTAAQLTSLGVESRPELLARALRACASLGIVTEDTAGRFGPTALSAVLTESAPGSVKQFVELIGGRWWHPIVDGGTRSAISRERSKEASQARIRVSPGDPRRPTRSIGGGSAER